MRLGLLPPLQLLTTAIMARTTEADKDAHFYQKRQEVQNFLELWWEDILNFSFYQYKLQVLQATAQPISK